MKKIKQIKTKEVLFSFQSINQKLEILKDKINEIIKEINNEKINSRHRFKK